MPAPRRRPTPEPRETNEVAVVAVGTLLWGVALLVLFLLPDRVAPGQHWLWTCVAGIGGGLVAFLYVRKRRRGIEKRRRVHG